MSQQDHVGVQKAFQTNAALQSLYQIKATIDKDTGLFAHATTKYLTSHANHLHFYGSISANSYSDNTFLPYERYRELFSGDKIGELLADSKQIIHHLTESVTGADIVNPAELTRYLTDILSPASADESLDVATFKKLIEQSSVSQVMLKQIYSNDLGNLFRDGHRLIDHMMGKLSIILGDQSVDVLNLYTKDVVSKHIKVIVADESHRFTKLPRDKLETFAVNLVELFDFLRLKSIMLNSTSGPLSTPDALAPIIRYRKLVASMGKPENKHLYDRLIRNLRAIQFIIMLASMINKLLKRTNSISYNYLIYTIILMMVGIAGVLSFLPYNNKLSG